MPKVVYTNTKGLIQETGTGMDLTGVPAGEGLQYRQPVVTSTAATLAPTVAQSGTIFLLSGASVCTVTLPAAEAGLVYEFHLVTTKTGTLTINAASSADTLEGLVTMAPSLTLTATNAGVTTAIAGPAAADHQFVADADTKGRMLGTHLVYKCCSASIWSITGICVTAGTCATPFT